MSCRRVWIACAAVTFALTRPAVAQGPLQMGVKDTSNLVPLILTVSGGISRGSYQGGLNWALVEIARRSSRDVAFQSWLGKVGDYPAPPKLFIAAAAGASAGNVNALISGIEWCRVEMASAPDSSIFWQAWVWTGWQQLMWNKATVRPDEHGLFDRKFFGDVVRPAIAAKIGPHAFQPNCRVPLGVTVTKLNPEMIAVGQDIVAANQRYAMPFTLNVGADSALEFRKPSELVLADPTLGEKIALPGRGSSVRLTLDDIFPVIEASSAFPLAFAPRTLSYYRPLGAQQGQPCQVRAGLTVCDSTQQAQFVDGGVFDNNPLGLAYGLYRCEPHTGTPLDPKKVKGKEPHAAQADSATFCRAPNESATLVYMDPDARRDRDGGSMRMNIDGGRAEGLEALERLVTTFINTGRQYELAVFARTLKLIPGAESTLHEVATDRFQAIVGDHFGAFGAFLGRPFREFDFYAGVYDGLYFAAGEWFCRAEAPGGPKSCTRRFLDAAVCGDRFKFDLAARAVMSLLYFQEFSARVSCDGAGRSASPGDKAVEARITVLRAVGQANEQIRLQPIQDSIKKLAIAKGNTAQAKLTGKKLSANDTARSTDPFGCGHKDLIQGVVCANGFSILLDSLRTPSTRAAFNALNAEPACKKPPKANDFEESVPFLNGCHADSTSTSLVNDAFRGADELFRHVLTRLDKVEDGGGQRKLVTAATFLYYNNRSPALRNLVFWSATIPNDAGWERYILHAAIPYHVSALVGNRSVIAGYRPTLYLTKFEVIFPLDLYHSFRHLRQPDGHFRLDQANAFQPGLGVGWNWAGHILQSTQAHVFYSMREWETQGGPNIGAEISATGLMNRFRIGWRWAPMADRGKFMVERQSLLVGIADVNGLAYWLLRLQQK